MNYNRRNLVHTHQNASFAATVAHEKSTGMNHAVLNAKAYYQHFLNTKCKPGEMVTITITNKKPKRTISQNNYYWLYLGIIAAETGDSIGDLHTFFKGKFLGEKIVEVFGEKVRRTKSTTELSVNDFGEYIDQIAALTEIEPPPTENYGVEYRASITPILREPQKLVNMLRNQLEDNARLQSQIPMQTK